MSSVSLTIKDFRKEIGGKISADKCTYEFPVIHTKNNRTGKDLIWQIVVRVALKDTIGDEANTKFVELKDEWMKPGAKMPKNLVGWIKVFRKQTDSDKFAKSKPTIVYEGKNIGNVDETNVFTQALRDALSRHNLQAKKSVNGVARDKYIKGDHRSKAAEGAQVTNAATRYPPMLLQSLEANRDLIDFSDKSGVWVQPKVDGVRVMATMETRKNAPYVLLYSRRKNEYLGLVHIKKKLEPVLKRYYKNGIRLYIDGEIYKHGWPLQKISGLARKEFEAGCIDKNVEELEFHIFDAFVEPMGGIRTNLPTQKSPYITRKRFVDDLFSKEFIGAKKLINVPTYQVKSHAEIDTKYREFVKEKYEGIIVRRGNMAYTFGFNEYHSTNVLKKKQFFDSEFKIVGYKSGEKGKSKDLLMIIVETPSGKQFPVTPALPEDRRRELYAEYGKKINGETYFNKHIHGRMLMVRYEDISADGIPLRARTPPGNDLVIRDYE